MKALVKTIPEPGIESLELVDVPYPKLQPGWVIIRVKKSGICGSDIHTVLSEWPQSTSRPFKRQMLGHEFAGQIVEVGEDVTDFVRGDRVIANPKYHCGTCYYCKSNLEVCCSNATFMRIDGFNGALAEYVTVPEYSLLNLPNHVSYEEGALCEPFTISFYAVFNFSNIGPGQTIVIIGPGPIGIATLIAVKLSTPGVIMMTGTRADLGIRLKIAKKLGADVTINVEEEHSLETVFKLTNGLGADIVYECAGTGLIGQYLNMLKCRGEFIAIGHPIKDNPIQFSPTDYMMAQRKHLKMIFDILYDWKSWFHCLQLIKYRRVNLQPLITHRVPLKDAIYGIELAIKKKALKVMITP